MSLQRWAALKLLRMIRDQGDICLEPRTSDPANPIDGQIWARTDLAEPNVLRYYRGGAVRKIGDGLLATAVREAANGVAGLDGSMLVPVAQLGTGGADATKYLRGDRMWVDPFVYRQIASSAAITNTTTETAFDKFPTIAANGLVGSSVLRARGYQRVSTGLLAGTLTCQLRYGGIAGVVLWTMPLAVTLVPLQIDKILQFDVSVLVRSAGASGTCRAWGSVTYRVAAGSDIGLVQVAGSVMDVIIDTTAAKDLVWTVQFSVADAANTSTLEGYTVEAW